MTVRSILAFAFAAALSSFAPAEPVKDIAAAVAAPDRTEKERALDANRKPAEVLAFAGIKRGDIVVDLGPGSGYYTRIISHLVGSKGRVFAINPSWVAEKFPKAVQGFAAGVATWSTQNVDASVQEVEKLTVSAPADVVFFSLEYHDQHWQKRDVAAMNAAVWKMLKPGGVYLIIDHSAQAGSGVRDVGTLHRIDPAVVRADLSAAGFAYAGESRVLRNPDDPLTEIVFGKIRGKTDQFIYKFVKAGR